LRALLLAAGLGTRLQPLTNYLPKCLVPIHGRPLLDYWLDNLLNNGVEEVLINTHYMAPVVQQYLDESSWATHVKTVYEDSLLGTGGTILKNREFLEGEAFLVAHADNLTIFDVQSFFAQHSTRPSHADLTMMVFKSQDPRSCGVVSLDANGIVQGFYEKVAEPPGNLANAAVYIFEPTVVERIASFDKAGVDISNDVIPSFIGQIFSWHNELYHRDIGTLESWIESNLDFPSMPASPINKRAWHKILENNQGQLSTVIEKLLMGGSKTENYLS